MTRVLVVGSINMDLVVTARRFPGPGETLAGLDASTCPGGKGANQAVAAARLGARVSLIGCLGSDAFGERLRAGLEQEGVDVRHVRQVPGPSGLASIILAGGENAIVVVPGANAALQAEDVMAAEEAFRHCDVVLAQLEVPMPAVMAAAVLAERHGKPFLLNPAPASPLPADLLARVTVLTPNEHEWAVVSGDSSGDWQAYLRAHPGRVVLTRGRAGVSHAGPDGTLRHVPAHAVTVVDSTGAGDTFNGALAAFWPRGLDEAVRCGNAAAALSVMAEGAQGGMPTLDALARFMAEGA